MAKTVIAEPPFSGWKIYGPYQNQGNRQIVIMYRPDGSRTGMDFGRYLMSVQMGRMLSTREHVDHIDNNPSNNTLANLQILTPGQNRRKNAAPMAVVQLQCMVCGNRFFREAHRVHKDVMRTNCSRSCGARGARQPIQHGTATGYGRGCRCAHCREAQRVKLKKWRHSKNATVGS